MPLALHNLAADCARIVMQLLLTSLVDMHRSLDVVASCRTTQALHLDILNLRLVDARALSREEFLLMVCASSQHALINFL